jgi:hypothetical protein
MCYLRQNKWCECERSCNANSGKLEEGVSVHKCKKIAEEKWQALGKTFTMIKNNFKNQPNLIGGLDSIWFLVEGKYVGDGSDGEPLLKNVVPYKIVKWDGSNYFIETEQSISDYHENHPDYPNCKCYSSDEEIELESTELD